MLTCIALNLLSPWSNNLLAFDNGISPNINLICLVVKALSTSVLVYVVDWFAFNAKALSTSVLVYVVALSAFIAKAVVGSALCWVYEAMFPLCIISLHGVKVASCFL